MKQIKSISKTALVIYSLLEMLFFATRSQGRLTLLAERDKLEEYYRLQHFMYYEVFRPDDSMGIALKPNLDELVCQGTLCFPIDTNDSGFRNNTPEEDAEIIVVGDSFGYGYGVGREESWSNKLEDYSTTQVANLSVIGHAPWQFNRNIKEHRDWIQNKVLLFTIYSNDCAKDRPSNNGEEYYHERNLYFYEQEEPTSAQLLFLATSPDFLKRTLTYAFFSSCKELIFGEKEALLERERRRALSDGTRIRGNENGLNDEDKKYFPELVRELDTAVALSIEYRSTLIPVLFPSLSSSYRDEYQQLYGHTKNIDIEETCYALIKQEFLARGVETLDLTIPFRSAASKSPLFLTIDHHLNPVGNELSAKEITCFLVTEGYAEPTKTTAEQCYTSD